MTHYTVDNLLEKLAVVGNNKIWKEIPEGVTIKGIVSNIKVYDKKSYFDLVGSGKRIRACCSSDDTPSEGAAIEFSGIITLQTNPHGTSLQIMINGSPVGTWERHKSSSALTGKDLVKYNNMPLSSLIERFENGSLLVVGSETGIHDVVSAINKDSFVKIEQSIVAVSKKADVLNLLMKIKKDSLKYQKLLPAFAVVRGGDDDSMMVWDDPDTVSALLDVGIPFFTALGHSHRVTLADKYAAQSFPTPGNFGSSINQEAEKYLYLQSMQNDKNNLVLSVKNNEAKIRFLENSEEKAQEKLQLLKSKNRGLRFMLWAFLVGFILLISLGTYLFIRS